MNNLLFSLNATMPVFLLMVLGYFLHRIHWINDDFASKLNQFVFRLPLPILVFSQLSVTDFKATWDGKFLAFCFSVTVLSITLCFLLSKFVKNKHSRGEFIQGAYRSSAALLGIAYIQNIYGSAEMSGLMILGSVPLYNIMAVIVLTLTSEEAEGLNKDTIKKSLLGICKNPIIIGILFGFLWSILQIPMPSILYTVITDLGATATPLGLMALGASIDFQKVSGKILPALAATFLKLIGLPAIFLPIAIFLGFRDQELVAILIMLGSATTVSCFVMAKNMGHEGTISSTTVMLTTVLSAFTLTTWVYILRTMALI